MFAVVGEGRTPVNLWVSAFGEDLLNDLGVQNLSEVLANEVEPLGSVRGRHCVGMV